MGKVLRILGGLAGIAALLAVAVLIWSSWPVPSAVGNPDPALEYLNARSDSDIDYTENWFPHEGNNIHYVEAGQGDAIVFLHGFPSFWMSHIRQMDALKTDYRVVAIDGLGVGKSDAPKAVEDYQLEAMAAHLAALLDHLGTGKIHLVGHDWGAAFALGFAQRYPERIVTVTGISSPPQNVMLSLLETSETQRQASKYIETLKGANPALLVALGAGKRVHEGAYAPLVDAGKLSAAEGDLFSQTVSQTKRLNAHISWYRANIPAVDAVSDELFWPSRDAKIKAPTLFIWGEDDPIITSDTINAMRSVSDDLQELSFKNAGHWPHVNEAETVTSAILDLISGSGGSTLNPPEPSSE